MSEYTEAITVNGNVQFTVWVRDADGSVYPVAHRRESEAIATIKAIAADPSLGTVVPSPHGTN